MDHNCFSKILKQAGFKKVKFRINLIIKPDIFPQNQSSLTFQNINFHYLKIKLILGWVMKVTKHTELWDAKLAWYSPSAAHQIYPRDLEHSQRIHIFLATQVKFLEPSGYCTVINCTFTFCTTNIFGCFCGIIVKFKLI